MCSGFMAAEGKEVEIKLAVEPAVFDRIKKELRTAYGPGKVSIQVDDYYTPAHRNFISPEFPFEWLSIRRRGGRAILNYKHFHPEGCDKFTHCDEIETELASPDQTEKIFAAMDIKKLITVEKEREKFVIGDFEVSMDSVKDAGFFIEVEALKDFGGVHKTRKAIEDFAIKLGLDPVKADNRGYHYLMLKSKKIV